MMEALARPIEPVRAAIDLDALRVLTEERLAQSERLLNTTQSAEAWKDYLRSCRYFEDVLALIKQHDAVLSVGIMLDV